MVRRRQIRQERADGQSVCCEMVVDQSYRAPPSTLGKATTQSSSPVPISLRGRSTSLRLIVYSGCLRSQRRWRDSAVRRTFIRIAAAACWWGRTHHRRYRRDATPHQPSNRHRPSTADAPASTAASMAPAAIFAVSAAPMNATPPLYQCASPLRHSLSVDVRPRFFIETTRRGHPPQFATLSSPRRRASRFEVRPAYRHLAPPASPRPHRGPSRGLPV